MKKIKILFIVSLLGNLGAALYFVRSQISENEMAVVGVAGNYKLAPGIVSSFGRIYYLDDMAPWGESLRGDVVMIKGTVYQSDRHKAPDEYSAGTQGNDWFIKDFSIQKVESITEDL